MAYKSSQIANYFINRGLAEGKGISPMKAIKLTYIAHGWHLAIYNQPLIREFVHAWKFGPVIDSLYHDLKKYGNQPIEKPIQSINLVGTKIQFITETIPAEDQRTEDFLAKIWDVYGEYTGVQLSNMTHADGTPWQQTVEPYSSKKYLPMGLPIPDEIIKEHFKQKEKANG